MDALGLLVGELKHEVIRKAFSIALDLFVEATGWDTIEARQISVKHDLMSPDEIDSLLDDLRRDDSKVSSSSFSCHGLLA